MVAGLEEPDSGRIVRGRNLDIRYLPQNPVFHPGETVLESVLRENEGHEHVWDLESQAKSMLNRLGIPDFNEKVEHLSGGQKKRAALASVLLSTAELLILDEPTNDLDIRTLMILEDYLDSFQGIVITVSHDRYFLDRVVGRIFAFEGDGKLQQYEGGFTDYQAAKAEREAKLAESAAEFATFAEWKEHAVRYEEELKKQNQEEGEETKDRVTLSTMHSAKGLEYPVVFVVDANEGIVPHHKAGLPADIEEERRLFYVALTRAKDRLHVAAVKERYHRKTDVSRFVEEAGL